MNPAFHAGAYARIVIATRSNAQRHARLASDGCVVCTTASRDLFILRGAEKVDVIGHDYVRADQAGVSLSPRLHESVLVDFPGERQRSGERANGEENDRGPVAGNQDTGCRLAPA
jgi:hypothetical protein